MNTNAVKEKLRSAHRVGRVEGNGSVLLTSETHVCFYQRSTAQFLRLLDVLRATYESVMQVSLSIQFISHIIFGTLTHFCRRPRRNVPASGNPFILYIDWRRLQIGLRVLGNMEPVLQRKSKRGWVAWNFLAVENIFQREVTSRQCSQKLWSSKCVLAPFFFKENLRTD